MGKRGPKPKPNVVKLVDGNPGRRPLGPEDPSKDPLGLAPQNMQDSEREIWNFVRRECLWLKRADRLLIQDFCRSWVIKRALESRLSALTVAGGATREIKEVGGEARGWGERCDWYMMTIGLTPRERAELSDLLLGQKEDEDEVDRLFA